MMLGKAKDNYPKKPKRPKETLKNVRNSREPLENILLVIDSKSYKFELESYDLNTMCTFSLSK